MKDDSTFPFDQELDPDFRPAKRSTADADITATMISFFNIIPFMAAIIASQIPPVTSYQSPIVHILGGSVTFFVLAASLLLLFFCRLVWYWFLVPISYVLTIMPIGDDQIRFVVGVFVFVWLITRILVRPFRRHKKNLEAAEKLRPGPSN